MKRNNERFLKEHQENSKTESSDGEETDMQESNTVVALVSEVKRSNVALLVKREVLWLH